MDTNEQKTTVGMEMLALLTEEKDDLFSVLSELVKTIPFKHYDLHTSDSDYRVPPLSDVAPEDGID